MHFLCPFHDFQLKHIAHQYSAFYFKRAMWGFLSKDPAKDFPYEVGDAEGQVALENKYYQSTVFEDQYTCIDQHSSKPTR